MCLERERESIRYRGYVCTHKYINRFTYIHTHTGVINGASNEMEKTTLYEDCMQT